MPDNNATSESPVFKIIVNPAAGARTTAQRWPQINRELLASGLRFDWEFTRGIGHAIEISRLAASDGYRLIVAVGGDGTVNEVVNGILESTHASSTALGVINTGTGCDFVRSLGIPRNIKNACQRLVTQHRQFVDVGMIEISGHKRRYFVNAAGTGFDAEVTERTRKLPKFMRGTVPYLLGLAGTLFGYRNKNVRLGIDERSEDRRILSLVVANGAYFGGGMHVAPGAELADNRFDVLTIGDFGKFELMQAFPRVYKGTHIGHPKVRFERAQKISVNSLDRLLLQADGEIVGEGAASFSILPRALTVLT